MSASDAEKGGRRCNVRELQREAVNMPSKINKTDKDNMISLICGIEGTK